MILDKRLREIVEPELGKEQLGFRKGRGTTDGMFSLRQLVEKRLEKQGHMALAFVDLVQPGHWRSKTSLSELCQDLIKSSIS